MLNQEFKKSANIIKVIYKDLFSSLSPYSFDVSPSSIDVPQVTHDSIPIGAIPLLASSTPDYQDGVSRTIAGANSVYQGMYLYPVFITALVKRSTCHCIVKLVF